MRGGRQKGVLAQPRRKRLAVAATLSSHTGLSSDFAASRSPTSTPACPVPRKTLATREKETKTPAAEEQKKQQEERKKKGRVDAALHVREAGEGRSIVDQCSVLGRRIRQGEKSLGESTGPQLTCVHLSLLLPLINPQNKFLSGCVPPPPPPPPPPLGTAAPPRVSLGPSAGVLFLGAAGRGWVGAREAEGWDEGTMTTITSLSGSQALRALRRTHGLPAGGLAFNNNSFCCGGCSEPVFKNKAN